MIVLGLLLQGHNTWLASRGAGGMLEILESIPTQMDSAFELIGMQAYRLAFGVALIVTAIETIVALYRLVRSYLMERSSADSIPAAVE
jgi:hypothetical protein